MSTNNGGPAFPEVVTHLDYNYDVEERFPNTYSVGGMTLRDYFAAKAMQGLIAQSCGSAPSSGFQFGAQYAYEMADAMIAARETK